MFFNNINCVFLLSKKIFFIELRKSETLAGCGFMQIFFSIPSCFDLPKGYNQTAKAHPLLNTFFTVTYFGFFSLLCFMNHSSQHLYLLVNLTTADEAVVTHWRKVTQNLHADFKLLKIGEELSFEELPGCLLIPEDHITDTLEQQVSQCILRQPYLHAVLVGDQFNFAMQKKWFMKSNYHWLPSSVTMENQTTFLAEILARSQRTLQQFIFCKTIDQSLVDLTSQSKEVLQYILQGKTNKEISLQLKCSQRTIESRRQHLLKILNVENAVAMAHKLGQYTAFKSIWS